MIQLGKGGPYRGFLRTFDGLWGSLGIILSSNVAVSGLTFATLVLTSRSLSPAGLGMLVMIEAYGRIFDQVLRLEPSQALIRQGTLHGRRSHGGPFRRLVKFGFMLDVGGSILAGAVAICLLPLFDAWFGFTTDTTALVLLFCVTLLVPAPMTSQAMLRLFDRFGLIARINVATALLRLAGTAGLWAIGGGLVHFVLLLCAVSIFERVLPTLVCLPLLRRRCGRGIGRTGLDGLQSENEGLWTSVWTANLNVLARSSIRHFDVVALSGFVGPGEIGLYVLGKRFAMLLIRLGSPLQLVVYPRMCQFAASRNLPEMARFVATLAACFAGLSAIGLLAFHLAGAGFVSRVFGADFVAATPIIFVQLAGACLLLLATILNAALQAVRREGQLLTVSVMAAAAFYAPLPFLVPQQGVMGASFLYLLASVIVLVGCSVAFAAALRSERRRSPAAG